MTREQTSGSGTARNWNAALGKNMARWLDIALPLFMARARHVASGNKVGFDKKIVEGFGKIGVGKNRVVKNGVRQLAQHG
jgi:hypothetical protein